METPTTPPAPPLYRRILLAVLFVETAFLLGVIAVAEIFHLDPTGDTSYWRDAAFIALVVLLVLVVPAFVLVWLGGYALVIATPLAAFAAFMCLTPYVRILFEWPPQVWFAIVVLMSLCAAAAVRYEKKKRAA